MQGMRNLDTVKVLTGSEAIDAVKALNDENRRQILHALRARRMSTTELAEFLSDPVAKKEVKPQTVRYHLKELEKCGLIEQDGYEPTGNGDSHIMQKLWRATAENVFIATGDMELLPERASEDLDRTLDLVNVMKQLGLILKDDKEMAIVNSDFSKRSEIMLRGLERAKETLRAACELDPELYVMFRRILSVVRLDEKDYEDYWEVNRRINDILRDAYRRGKGKNPEVF
ncbi:MAG: winged helix-turn-helix domain-containing protein [Candidatus Thorarchaeota archaeon]|nr:winged helix-turn-helix domain-containing protein [Candidatus Thorarchaeota archaeon]